MNCFYIKISLFCPIHYFRFLKAKSWKACLMFSIAKVCILVIKNIVFDNWKHCFLLLFFDFVLFKQPRLPCVGNNS